MFPLSGRLIRLNKDGSNGEIIHANKKNLVFGTSIFDDYHIKDIDPEIEVSCEISTDEYGRVSITNKTNSEIFVNDKSFIRPSVRPLFNNNIIKICDGVEFRWVVDKQAKENVGGDLNDADFASYSDPGKKHMKVTRVQRVKGRLTAHPINLYASAYDDVNDKDVPSTQSDDERSTGCSVLPEELNDSVFKQDLNVTAPLVDVSRELINLDETQTHVPSGNASEQHTSSVTLVENELATDADLMNFETTTEQSTECKSVSIMSQPSNCSVITVSSDGSKEAVTQETDEKNVDDEEMFERSISCPPSELPDDLFETSDNDDEHDENMATACNTEGVYITDKDKANVNYEQTELDVEAKGHKENVKISSRRSSLDIDSSNNVTKSDTSIEQITSNDDDLVIPETQELLSQDTSCSVIDCDKSEYSFESKAIVSETVQQNISIDQPNMSIVSLSSDEGEEKSRVESANEDSKILDSEDMFETEALDEHPLNVEVKAEVTSNPVKSQEDEKVHEKRTHCEPSSTFNESDLFSQSLSVDANESMTDTQPNLFENSTSETSQPKSTLLDSEKIADTTTKNDLQNTTVEGIQSELQPVELHKCDTILASSDVFDDEVQSEAAQNETVKTANGTITNRSFLSESQFKTDQLESESTENESNVSVDESIVTPRNNDPADASNIEEAVTKMKETKPFEMNSDEAESVVPVATSSTVSVCLSTDTTQELNLLAFHSEFGVQSDDQMDNDTMDTLEFSSSDSMIESNDSGHITVSCENTSSVNVSETNQMDSPSMKSTCDISVAEINVVQTPTKENAFVADSTTASPIADLSKIEEVLGNEPEITRITSEETLPKTSLAGQDEETGNDSTQKKDKVDESMNEVVMTSQNYEEFVATPDQSAIECNSSVTRSTRRRRPSIFEMITNSVISTPRNKIQTQLLSKVTFHESAIHNEDDFQESDESASLVDQANANQNDNTKNEALPNIDDELKHILGEKKFEEYVDMVQSIVQKKSEEDAEVIGDQNEKSETGTEIETEEDITSLTTVQNVIKSDEIRFSTLPRATRRKSLIAELSSVTPKRTPRKLNVSSAVPTKISTSHVEKPQEQEESEEKSEVKSTKDDSVENEHVDPALDVLFETPAKIPMPTKGDSTITRSSRRNQANIAAEALTPKRTPRKLNVTQIIEKSSDVEIQTLSGSSQNEKITEDKHVEENVELEHPIDKEEPMQTDEETAVMPLEEVTANGEAITDQSEPNDTEIPQSMDKNTTFSTPVQSIMKSDESRALTLPRSTRRKPLIAELSSVTPKRTPRKLNVSSAVVTEISTSLVKKPQQQGKSEEKSEVKSTKDDSVENEHVDPALDVLFATPAKIPMSTKGDSTITRSSRRNQANIAAEALTPKRTPRKLNVTQIIEKSSDVEIQTLSGSSQNEKITEDKHVEENVELQQPIDKEEPMQTGEETAVMPLEEVTANGEAITDQSEPNDTEIPQSMAKNTTFSTPVQSIMKSDESRALTLPRSTRRKPLIAELSSVTPKRTPRKLNVSSAVVTEISTSLVEKPQQNEESEKQLDVTSIKDDYVDNEPADPALTDFFTTPSKSSKPTVSEYNQNDNMSKETQVEKNGESVQLIEKVTTSDEAITEPSEKNDTEIPRSMEESTTISTPSQSVVKSDKLSAFLTLPRSTRRKPLIPELVSVPPKRTPRKVNVSLALATETSSAHVEKPQEQEESEKQSEVTSNKDEFVDDEPDDPALADLFRTPAKTPIVTVSENNQNENITEETQVEENLDSVQSIEKQETIQADNDTTTSDEAITDQSELKDSDIPQSMDKNTTFSTPVQSIMKSDESRALTLPRSTRRKPMIAELSSVTPKRTPRKLNVSSAVVTEISTSLIEKPPQQDKREEKSEVMSIEDDFVENEAADPALDVLFATPAKIPMPSKSNSTITRSSRRNPANIAAEALTPKRTPRKLNVTQIIEKSSDVEIQTMSGSSQNEKITEDKHVEENVELEQPIDKEEPMQTGEGTAVMPLEEVTANGEAITDQSEPKDSDIPQSMAKNTTFSTPVQSIMKSDESRALTLPRSTRRKPLIAELSSVTPKRTPRKLNVSSAVPTKISNSHVEKPQEQGESEKQSEVTSNKDEFVDDEPDDPALADLFRTPAKTPIVTVSENNQNENITEETQVEENLDSVQSIEKQETIQADNDTTTSDEAITDQIEPNDTDVPQSMAKNTTFSSPVQSIMKSDESRALTLPRSTRRKPLIAELSSVTPKRTPRKLNVSSAVATEISTSLIEKPPQQDKREEKSEVMSIEDDFVENEAADPALDVLFATPAKIPMPSKSNSTITRSSRRIPANIAAEASTPKRTPRKLNVSQITETPSDAEIKSSSQSDQDVTEDKQTEELIEMVSSVDELYDMVLQTDKDAVSTSNDDITINSGAVEAHTEENRSELHENINDVATDDQPVFSTAVQNVLQSIEALTSHRATRRKPLVGELSSVTLKRTPGKLNANPALPAETPALQTEKFILGSQLLADEKVCLIADTVPNEQSAFDQIPVSKQSPSKLLKLEIEPVPTQNNITVASTPVGRGLNNKFDEKVSSVTRSKRRKQNTEMPTPKQTPKKLNAGLAQETPRKSEIVFSPVEGKQAESASIVERSGNILVIRKVKVIETTPTKQVISPTLSEKFDSAVARSSKRKRPDLENGTPIGKRTPQKVHTKTPLKVQALREVPSTTTGEIYDVVVPAKITKATRVTRSSKANQRMTHMSSVEREVIVQTPRNYNCVVNVTPLKAETLKAHRSTKSQKNVTTDLLLTSTTPKDTLAIATPSTSQTSSTSLKPQKRVIRTRSTNKTKLANEHSNEALSALVAELPEKIRNDNVANLRFDMAAKRAGTPLPASKKRGERLTGQKAKLSLESNNKPNPIDSGKRNAIDANHRVDDGVVAKGKTTRRKKNEEVVPKASGSSATPLNKRNRNSVVEPTEETPSTSRSTETVAADEFKNLKEKSEKVSAKRSRPVGARIDSTENSQKKLKIQLDHANLAAVVGDSPQSLHLLRNCLMSIDESSLIPTPKRARSQRKVNNDEKVESVVPKQKEDEVEKATPAPAPVESEKPKRQPRRKIVRNINVDEPLNGSITQINGETSGSVVKESNEVEKPKTATKRSRAKSKIPIDDSQPNGDGASVKPPAKRGRKGSQAQKQAQVLPVVTVEPVPIEPVDNKTGRGRQAKLVVIAEHFVDLTEDSTEQPVEKTVRRGRQKKNGETEPIQAPTPKTQAQAPDPAPASKKRTTRVRTVSKSEENIQKPSTEEPPMLGIIEESTKPPPKTKGKRTRKVDTELVEVEEEKEKKSSPKRSRNTKKAKEPEAEVKLSAKDTVAEKKARKTKETAESNDNEPSISSPPISARTRQRK